MGSMGKVRRIDGDRSGSMEIDMERIFFIFN